MAVDGTIKAICGRLQVTDAGSRTKKDLSEQCIKVSNGLLYGGLLLVPFGSLSISLSVLAFADLLFLAFSLLLATFCILLPIITAHDLL